MNKNKNKQTLTQVIIIGMTVIVAILLVGIGSYAMARQVGLKGETLIAEFFSRNPTATPDGFVASPTPNTPIFEFDPFSEPLGEPWDGSERVTILLMGVDFRDWENPGNGASRSDTMILVTIDPVTKTAGILSVPRDLWVDIPGFQPNKINAAYYFGDAYKLPGGGPGLAIKTVEQVIGVDIDYYAQVDFNVFVDLVNLIHGVKIDVPERIKIDPLGSSPPRYLEPGVQVLDGELALAYARNRATGDGDFGRAERQQQVILAIRERLLNPKILNELITNASQLYETFSSGIRTNLPLNDAIQLALLGIQVKDGDIRRGVINEDYTIYGRSPDDKSILIPIPDRIRALRDEVFFTGSAFSPQIEGNLQERMAQEAATIVLYNGSNSGNLDSRTVEFLNNQGAQASSGGGTGNSFSTHVIDYTGNPYTLAYLVELMGIAPEQIEQQYNPNSNTDIQLILGTDWANNNSLP